MKKKPASKPPVVARNPVVLNPLLRKSSVHQKTAKSKRRAERVAFKKTWFEQVTGLPVTRQNHVELAHCNCLAL